MGLDCGVLELLLWTGARKTTRLPTTWQSSGIPSPIWRLSFLLLSLSTELWKIVWKLATFWPMPYYFWLVLDHGPFHCTLLYTSQMLDELPMLFGACSFLYCMWMCSSRQGETDWLAISVTVCYAVVTSLMYLTVNEPVFHELCYSIIVVLLTLYSTYQFRKLGGSRSLYCVSLSAYAVGFILWNIEVQFCPSLRHVCDSVVWPLKPVTQLHAWWHVLSGGGSHLHVLFSCHMRMQKLGYPCKLVLYGGCIPVLEAPREWTERKQH